MSIVLLFFGLLVKAQDPFGNDVSGDGQFGDVNTSLKKPITVRVLSARGEPLQNAAVEFSIINEPAENAVGNKFARLDAERILTNSDGYAMVKLTLGKTPGKYYIAVRQGSEVLIFTSAATVKNWLLFLLISVAGGLALFIFGLNYGSKGLIRESGSKMRDLLFSITNNRFAALFTGIIAAVILGSGTAAAVLLVRFASTGIIALQQALGVLLGADIGTTILVQLLAFNILDYALLIVAAGVFLRLLVPSARNIAQFIFGLGLLFFALKIMSSAAVNLKYVPGFASLIDYVSDYPAAGVVAGAFFAFVFHSSAAIIGIVLILAFESLINMRAGFALVLGANLGTTFSTIIAAQTVNGRRVAFGHLLFRLTATVIALPLIGPLVGIMGSLGGGVARQVANFHTLFNVFIAVVFVPVLRPVERMLNFVIKESKQDGLRAKRLDTTFHAAPAIALGEASREIISMANFALKMVEDSVRVFDKKDIVLRKKVIEMDDRVDESTELITPYLTQLSHEEMNDMLSLHRNALLSVVNELEHVGDVVSKNLMEHAKKQIDNGLVFSEEGLKDIVEFQGFVLASLRMAVASLTARDTGLAREAAARREPGLDMAKHYEAKHLSRLAKGLKETLETSTIHLDIISDYERINFHASEIGKALK